MKNGCDFKLQSQATLTCFLFLSFGQVMECDKFKAER